MELTTLWFMLIAVLWLGYLVLEGFDFGVGMLLPILDRNDDGSRNDKRRRVLINTIAPVWDGNEVWLITAGGATFAAFPDWYATLFSGFYLPLLIILVALIVRGLAFEYRSKRNSDRWRAHWDRCIIIGSYLPSVIWGVAFANLLRGVPINADKQFTGTLFTLLNPYALLGGLTTLALFVLHGAIYIALKTAGPIQRDAARLAARAAPATTVIAGAFAVLTHLLYGNRWTAVPVVVAAAGLMAAVVYTRAKREGRAFAATTITITAAVILIFGALFPNLMVSSTAPEFSLTTTNASSTPYTLKVMSWVAISLTPVVLVYQGWTYWVFRKRLTTDMIPDHIGLTAADVAATRRPATTDTTPTD